MNIESPLRLSAPLTLRNRGLGVAAVHGGFEVYLEISELQERFGLKHGELNAFLAQRGWQKRLAPGQWEPTRETREMGYCTRHAWVNKNKSGINWKWKLTFIEGQLRHG